MKRVVLTALRAWLAVVILVNHCHGGSSDGESEPSADHYGQNLLFGMLNIKWATWRGSHGRYIAAV